LIKPTVSANQLLEAFFTFAVYHFPFFLKFYLFGIAFEESQ